MPKSVHGVMSEFKRGELHSGSKSGPVVKNRRQAIAIALSEQRQKGAQVKTKYHGSGEFTKAEENRGYKVYCTASELGKMDSDRYENVKEFTLASRRESTLGSASKRKVLRRSESTKGKY